MTELTKDCAALAQRIKMHLALKDSSPGFHLSDDDLALIADRLTTTAAEGREAIIDECANKVRFCGECDCPKMSVDAILSLKTTVQRSGVQTNDERIAQLQYEAGMYKSLYENAIEQCAKAAEGTAPVAAGNFFSARRDQCAKIAAKIRALAVSNGERA